MEIDLATGSELAGHRIDSVIGRGGMGVVYLAQHLRLGRKVALKVLVPELAQDEFFRERFVRESQLAAALDHPSVIPIYDAGEVQDLLYISMRYVEGSDLSVLLHREHKLDVEDTLSVMGQVASALDAAHREGLVHRDVKPANILMEDREEAGRRIFLTDFGITKSLRREGDSLTRAGQLIGSIDYMAPEQITSQPVDGRTDVYSLGCIAYRCLTGTLPYPRGHEVAVMYAHLQDTPPSVTSAMPDLPEAVDKVVRKAMAKSKEARFATCSEFIDALRPHLTTTPERTATRGRHRRASTPGALDKPASRHIAASPDRRAGRWWIAASVAGLVGVTVVAALLLTKGSPGSTGGPQASSSGGPARTSGTTSPPPSESAGPQAPVLTWRQVPQSPLVFGGPGPQTINRVIANRKNILGVGYSYSETSGDNDAAVWTASRNGGSWTKHAFDSGGGPGDQGMAAVARLGGQLVAVGSSTRGSVLDAAAWHSLNGSSWEPYSSRSFSGPGDEQMRRVVRGGDDLVAVGYDTTTAGDEDGAVWNFDGETWNTSTNAEFGGRGDQEMWSIAASGTTLVAVGQDDANGDLDAAAWRYTQATQWHRVGGPLLTTPGDQLMKTVIAYGTGFVAVGYDTFSGTEDAAVWISEDGRTWVPVHDPEALGGEGDQEMFGVVEVDGNLVAVGRETVAGDFNGVVWISSDGGRTWTKQTPRALGGPGDQEIKSVTELNGRLIAVGYETSTAREQDAAVWVATIQSS